MFSRQHDSQLADLSTDLRDENDWKVGSLKAFDFPLNVTSLAIEPISRLLAAGTSEGSIYIFGRPGVHCKISLPQPTDVRLLQFSVSTFNIVCVDGNNKLHVYSLLEFGKPKLVASVRFDQTNSMTLSPSHDHAFLATQNGDVKTYDLMCLRKSPYTIPNLWKLYEEKMAASGMPSLTLPTPTNAVEVVIHPRNLDHMFVAYAGGIILTDLTERSSIRVYELTLPPGAPGGAGYGTDDILTHRRMTVTSLALHPSGHFFAAGYEDGSIAFWAVEDDNKPLLVRTLDEVEVNIVHGEHLERHLSNPTKSKTQYIKEPIFKLSWSSYPNSADPRGGDTTLTILGGLGAGKPPGLTIFLLPAFNPSEPPSDPAPQNQLHPFFRNAMCQTLTPKKSFFYETLGLVQDYLLLPRSTPHLAGNSDPYAILIVTEFNDTRTAEAYQYPPPGFIRTVPEASKNEADQQDEGGDEKDTTDGILSPPPPTPLPKSPQHLTHTPLPLRTPFSLSVGNAGILGGHLFKLEKDTYLGIISQNSGTDLHLELKGGNAYTDPTNELKLLKYQPRRILVTYNRDLTVQFFDISPQLLLPDTTANSLLEKDWPEALPALTIRLDEVLDDPAIVDLVTAPIDQISIYSIQFAPEALECAVVLRSGEVLVYHEVANRSEPSRLSTDREIVLLDHVYSRPGSKLVPYFMLAPGKGPVETCAMSDIGFLAVSYKDGSLSIIDMRGPNIILASGKSKRQRHSSAFIHLAGGVSGASHGPAVDVTTSLAWTLIYVIPFVHTDHQLSVRLIVAHQSGHGEVYTIAHSGNPASWGILGEPVECKAVPEPLPDGIFILDKKTGAPWRADRARFAASFKGGMAPVVTASGGSAGNQCFLLVVGAKGARTSANITGDRVGKVDWGSKVGNVQSVQIVEHMGSRALVVQTDRHDALIYSLPHLEYVCTLQIPTISSLPMTIDDTGDFIAWTPYSRAPSGAVTVLQGATYGTFFDVRRAYIPPDIDFASSRGVAPAQPQPVSLGPASILGSWFTYNQTLTGTAVDDLLGGPDRPIPEKLTQQNKSTSGEGSAASGATAGFAAGAAAVQENFYNRLTSAMSERGQMLGDLEERFNSLEEGSRNMVAQAKRLATQQTAKSWFGF